MTRGTLGFCTLLLSGALLLASCDGEVPREDSDTSVRGLPLLEEPSQRPFEKLSPALQHFVREGGDQRVRALVEYRTQLDVVSLGRRLMDEGVKRAGRRDSLVASLQKVADYGAAQLARHLSRLSEGNELAILDHLAIVGAVLVEGSPVALESLAEQAAVGAMRERTAAVASVLATAPRASGVASQEQASWAVSAVGADSAWLQGLDGSGVVVGLMDAGVSATHEQLREGLRGGPSAWHDPTGKRDSPADEIHGHGTSVLSVAVGRNPGEDRVGVAPGATWVACFALPNGIYDNLVFLQCADWMLTVGRPDILINPWVLPTEGCDRSLTRVMDAWRAAEILPVFAAGNRGPAFGTDRSPANYSELYPGDATTLSVGGIVADDGDGVRYLSFGASSRGPSSCGGNVYPSVSAPAANVRTAFPLTPSSYFTTEGTSVASGLVGGIAALLLQRHPEASVAELEAALRLGAVDLGEPGPDNRFGFGMVYAPGAVSALDGLRRETETATQARDTARQR